MGFPSFFDNVPKRWEFYFYFLGFKFGMVDWNISADQVRLGLVWADKV